MADDNVIETETDAHNAVLIYLGSVLINLSEPRPDYRKITRYLERAIANTGIALAMQRPEKPGPDESATGP